MTATYDVHRSRFTGEPAPAGGKYYPDLLTGASREEAVRFAIDRSAADPDGRTYIVSNHETWKTVAEYRNGRLRTDRPHDRHAVAT
jgi:hypothetical protein